MVRKSVIRADVGVRHRVSHTAMFTDKQILDCEVPHNPACFTRPSKKKQHGGNNCDPTQREARLESR